MFYARWQPPNAPLTAEGRGGMVRWVVEYGWTIDATAERFQVDAETVLKWRDRFLAAGLEDRSSRPAKTS
ncbi:MAG: helix-turn-helix domain-containing protein, partial [Acidimicrobiia bacterium]